MRIYFCVNPKMQTLPQTAGPGLKIFSTLGDMYAFEERELGAVGVMPGFVYANPPEIKYQRLKIRAVCVLETTSKQTLLVI